MGNILNDNHVLLDVVFINNLFNSFCKSCWENLKFVFILSQNKRPFQKWFSKHKLFNCKNAKKYLVSYFGFK